MIFELVYANRKLYKKTEDMLDSGIAKSVNEVNGEISKYYPGYVGDLVNKLTDNSYHYYVIKQNATTGEKKIKYYLSSNQFYELIGKKIPEKAVDFSVFDLAPMVKLWSGMGRVYGKTDDQYHELFFDVDNSDHLRQISDYYGLEYPLPDGITFKENSSQWESNGLFISLDRVGGYPPTISDSKRDETHSIMLNFKIGSVVFENNVPTLIKMYKGNHLDRNYATHEE